MNCDIAEFVQAVAAEGAPCWKVFWPQCHTERAFTASTMPSAVGVSRSSRRNMPTRPASITATFPSRNAIWHESHTFTCFAYPSYTEADMVQIAEAVTKVIRWYAKRSGREPQCAEALEMARKTG